MKNLFLSIGLAIVVFSCQKRIENANTLFEIIRSKNVEALSNREIGKKMLQQKDASGNTAIMIAIETNNVAMVNLLLEKGADPNAQNAKRKTAMQLAQKNGNQEIINAIKTFQYDDWKLRSDKFTQEALLYALDNDNQFIVSDFLKNGTKVNHIFEATGIPLLIQAIFSDSVHCSKLLLEKKADPNIFFDTRPAITIAAMFGQYEICKMMLDAGADPNLPDGPLTTSLMFASKEGHTKVVELLLAYGADKSLEDIEKKTALDKAKEAKHNDIIKMLYPNFSFIKS